MALLTQQAITIAGLTPSYTAVNASDTATPDTDLILHVKTAGTGTTVTLVDSSKSAAGSTATNPTVVLGATAERFISLSAAFGLVSGIITINYSSTATCTAALLKQA